jgi:hypothetical protein
MIQRKQTLLLLMAVILGVMTLSMPIASVTGDGLSFSRIYNLLRMDMHGQVYYDVWPLFLLLLLPSAISMYTIFQYKRRMLQAALCLISMLLYVVWYIALIVYSKMLAPDALGFQLTWVAALPAVCALLNLMARKAIIADEKLVRAADRIR